MASKRWKFSFLVSIPIGTLGGLIGLGGAEFRLPVLTRAIGFEARKAIPVNLAVSLVTVVSSLAIRSMTLSLTDINSIGIEIVSLIFGAVISAFFGTALVGKISTVQLQRMIVFLLVMIGVMLIVEAFAPTSTSAFVPNVRAWRIGAGLGFGLAIGLVSSLLGVAGGELIIPTLIFAFGYDIKTAGTASLLVSLPTVSVGLLRYASQGVFRDRSAAKDVILPMALGSVVGAVLGGRWVGIIPVQLLKLGLGIILNWSAFKMFRKALP